jgi:hypothetical protein
MAFRKKPTSAEARHVASNAVNSSICDAITVSSSAPQLLKNEW